MRINAINKLFLAWTI